MKTRQRLWRLHTDANTHQIVSTGINGKNGRANKNCKPRTEDLRSNKRDMWLTCTGGFGRSRDRELRFLKTKDCAQLVGVFVSGFRATQLLENIDMFCFEFFASPEAQTSDCCFLLRSLASRIMYQQHLARAHTISEELASCNFGQPLSEMPLARHPFPYRA